MELVNKEAQLVRHERLKQYYDVCYEECVDQREVGCCCMVCWKPISAVMWLMDACRWDQELRARGLAIVRDRD